MRPRNPSECEISLKCLMTANIAKIVSQQSILSPSENRDSSSAAFSVLIPKTRDGKQI